MYLAELISGKDNSYYLYDALTNQTTLLNNQLYNYITNKTLRDTNINSYKKILAQYNLRDVFEPTKFEIEYYFSDEELKWHLDNKMETLTLNMTEKCNMRCRYCAYYDKYLDHKSTDEDMNRETAFAAIDYFLKHSQKSPHIGIAFYGGETLLCFELIKECIEYANKNRMGHNITFHIFTNGLRLAEPSIRKFLIDNQIYICVSLDGPRQLHDRYRITATEDTTYDTIIKNLKCIQKESNDYLENYVSFNVVVAPPYNKSLLYDFCENIAQYTRLISLSMTEYFKKELEGKDMSEDKPIDIFSYKKMRSTVLHDFYKYHNPPNYHSNPKIYPTGTCIPGVKKIFVRNSGDILLCEKVDENNPLFYIGNVKDGIDFDKIKNVLNQYTQILSKKCSSCWASHFCPVCFREIENMETKSCDIIRNRIKKEYQSYLTNVSGNKELCDFLDNLKII